MADNKLDINKDSTNILGQLISKGLNPRQDNILKTLLKFEKQQAEEFLQQTGGSEEAKKHVLQQAGIPSSEGEAVQQISSPQNPTELVGDERSVSQALANQTEAGQKQQTQRRNINPLKLLSNLVQGVVDIVPTSASARLANAQTALAQQELSGNVPLQKGDLQKLAIKQAQDLDKLGQLTSNQLLGKFEPVANQFQSIFDSHQRVLASVEDPSPAGDLALIFNFMKILDPQSVVREGEFSNAQNSGAIPDRIRNIYNKLLSGERLTKTQRKDFETRANKLFNKKELSFKGDRKQFERLARKNNLDPERIFRQVGSNALEKISLDQMTDEQLQAIIGE